MFKRRSVNLLFCIVTLASFAMIAANWQSLFYKNTLFVNGRIFTVDDQQPWVEAVEVRNGIITYVGEGKDLEDRIGWRTHVIDLKGQTMMPGLHDAHIHLFFGSRDTRVFCDLPVGADPDGIITRLQECQNDGRMTDGWLVGVPFDPMVFPDHQPDNRFLNDAFPETPVYLTEFSQHNGLANQKAFDALGIDETVANPPEGSFGRFTDSGNLNGHLVEKVHMQLSTQIPQPSIFTLAGATLDTLKDLNRHGVTSIQDATAAGPVVRLYQILDTMGLLPLHIETHWIQGMKGLVMATEQQQKDWLQDRASYSSDNLNVNNAKLFLDGVPLPPTPTDARLDPQTGLPEAKHLLHTEDELYGFLSKLDRMAIKTKTHAVGDGAARTLINALERVRRDNGKPDVFHEVVHAQGTHPNDIKRFVDAQTVLEYSPSFWAYPDMMNEIVFPFKTATDAGAMVTAGTDWPVVPDVNLFPAIAGMVDNGAESIDLETAVQIFTLNGAVANKREDRYGSIEVGKWANMIVLDRDIFTIPTADIAGTQVTQTYFKGKLVYQDKKPQSE